MVGSWTIKKYNEEYNHDTIEKNKKLECFSYLNYQQYNIQMDKRSSKYMKCFRRLAITNINTAAYTSE